MSMPSDATAVGAGDGGLVVGAGDGGMVGTAVGAGDACPAGTDAHAAVNVAGGTAVVAGIVIGDAPSQMGSPPHRAEEGPVLSAADAGVGALQSCLGTDAHAAVNVAGGAAVVAGIVIGDAPSQMGSPLHRAEEGQVCNAADAGVGALQNC